MKINKEMNIKEVLDNYPKVIEVFRELDIGCVGCLAAHTESLEEGLKVHGFDDKKIEEVVKRMNKLVKD